MARKSSQQILDALSTADDGRLNREVGIWSLEKLAIIMLYIAGFSSACKRAQGGYFVDGLAGPGKCRVRNAVVPPEFVKGSSLIALDTEPKVEQCILMEKGAKEAAVLGERTLSYGDRAIARRGDVNTDLVALIEQHVRPKAPCFCLLDPEGIELHWSTVRAIAMLPGRKRKPELLILYPIDTAIRLFLTKKPMPEYTRHQLERWLGTLAWEEIYGARVAGSISASSAMEKYVDLYEEGLRGIGYAHVQGTSVIAPAVRGSQRRRMYRLIFATDHVTGAEIMDRVFTRPYVLDLPVSQQPPLGI